jgi:hypothetical protein
MATDRLLDIIDTKTMTASTGSIDISFGEISSMYPGELEIKPAYQRLFRWSETQQSQFIESLILELPIPPIFVIETESRKYDLIDGLQRISSFLHFLGILQSDRYPMGDKLKLQNCDIVTDLNGLTFEDFSPALKIKVRRSYVRMQIIKRESPKRLKYDMFKRLNTGGLLLSAQEIRNSTIRLLDERFIDFIQRLKDGKEFKQAISSVMAESVSEQFDDELILRFFTIKNANLEQYVGTLADYMTTYAERVSDNDSGLVFDYEREEKIFKKTFSLLNAILPQGKIFSNLNDTGYRQRQFLAFHFEAFSIGIAKYWNKIEVADTPKINALRTSFLKLKKDSDFIDATKNEKERRSSASKYVKYLRLRISIVQKEIAKVI